MLKLVKKPTSSAGPRTTEDFYLLLLFLTVKLLFFGLTRNLDERRQLCLTRRTITIHFTKFYVYVHNTLFFGLMPVVLSIKKIKIIHKKSLTLSRYKGKGKHFTLRKLWLSVVKHQNQESISINVEKYKNFTYKSFLTQSFLVSATFLNSAWSFF